MKDLFKKYTIKAKIKIIAFSAMLIIILMITSISILSHYFVKHEDKFYDNQEKLTMLSLDLQKLLLQDNLSSKNRDEIVKYFQKIEKLDTSHAFFQKNFSLERLFNIYIVFLSILLILFMFFGYILKENIEKSLLSLQKGIDKFFDYIIHNNTQIDKIDVIYKDEIGSVLNFINDKLPKVNKIIENEREFSKQLKQNIENQTDLIKEKTNYLEQFKYMIDQAEAVIQFNMFGDITDVNDHYCALSQYNREELIGQPIVNYISSHKDEDDFSQVIINVIKEGTIYKGINSDLTKDGKKFTTKTVILPLVNKDKIIEYFFCVRTDITELMVLTDEIIATQKDVISTMGEIGESRSKETGLHVKRVAEYSRLLAKKCDLDKEQSELIYNASPMHDIGKVAIPDKILKKPGKLTYEEFETMKTHARLGYDMLKNSKRDILNAAAIIAYEHHERYDGSGYPNNKKGEDIHIFGRITAIADVFDALGSERCYKKAWELNDIIEFLIKEKGKHLDPNLVDLLLDNLDEFLEIRDRLKDVF